MKSVPIVIGTSIVWPGPIGVTVVFDAVKVVVPLLALPPRSWSSAAFWLASTGSPVVRVGSLLTTELIFGPIVTVYEPLSRCGVAKGH